MFRRQNHCPMLIIIIKVTCLDYTLGYNRSWTAFQAACFSFNPCFGLLGYFWSLLCLTISLWESTCTISWEIHSKTWLLIEMNTKRELNCLEMNTAIEVDSRRLLNNEVLIGPWIILDQRYIIVQIFDIFSFFLSFKFSFWPPINHDLCNTP